MTGWAKDELEKLAEIDELHIAPFVEDRKTYGTPTWIWSVVVVQPEVAIFGYPVKHGNYQRSHAPGVPRARWALAQERRTCVSPAATRFLLVTRQTLCLLLSVSESDVSNLLAMAGRHQPIRGACQLCQRGSRHGGGPGFCAILRDNNASDLKVLAQLEGFQTPPKTLRVFPVVRASAPSRRHMSRLKPIQLLAFLGNF